MWNSRIPQHCRYSSGFLAGFLINPLLNHYTNLTEIVSCMSTNDNRQVSRVMNRDTPCLSKHGFWFPSLSFSHHWNTAQLGLRKLSLFVAASLVSPNEPGRFIHIQRQNQRTNSSGKKEIRNRCIRKIMCIIYNQPVFATGIHVT